jgi:hypothetical protein
VRALCVLVACVLMLAGSCATSSDEVVAESAAASTSEPVSVAPSAATSLSTVVMTTSTTVQITSTIPQSTSTSVATQDEAAWDPEEGAVALATVDSFYAAINSGDTEAALALVHDARFAEKLPIAIEGLRSQFAYDCTLGETQGLVNCTEDATDDLYGPAGITNQAFVNYWYRNDKPIAADGRHQSFVCEFDPTGDSLSFLMEFRVWAAEAHPELERYWVWGVPIASTLAIPCTVYPFRSPEDATEISKIVPEFVTQSDRWPTDGT